MHKCPFDGNKLSFAVIFYWRVEKSPDKTWQSRPSWISCREFWHVDSEAVSSTAHTSACMRDLLLLLSSGSEICCLLHSKTAVFCMWNLQPSACENCCHITTFVTFHVWFYDWLISIIIRYLSCPHHVNKFSTVLTAYVIWYDSFCA